MENKGGVEIKGSCNHYIDCEVMCGQVGRWRYTGFYGCPERHRREESWSLLTQLYGVSQLPWCIAGDFNDIMFDHEKKGGRPQPRFLLDGFRNVVANCGLTDLGFSGSEFTWESSRGSAAWIQERLDSCLANYDWKAIFPLAEVKVVEVSTFDHLLYFLN